MKRKIIKTKKRCIINGNIVTCKVCNHKFKKRIKISPRCSKCGTNFLRE